MGVCTICRGVTPDGELTHGRVEGNLVMSLCPDCYDKVVGDKGAKKVKFEGD